MTVTELATRSRGVGNRVAVTIVSGNNPWDRAVSIGLAASRPMASAVAVVTVFMKSSEAMNVAYVRSVEGQTKLWHPILGGLSLQKGKRFHFADPQLRRTFVATTTEIRTTERPDRRMGDVDGRSPGSRVTANALPSRFPSGTFGRQLVAYSCGGSHGFGLSLTVFPFHPLRGTVAAIVTRRGWVESSPGS
jgi:hypothetical protein